MPCQILVSNNSSIDRSEIILLRDGLHEWSFRETMQAWINAGNDKSLWDRVFSLVIVSDKELSDLDKRMIDDCPHTNIKDKINIVEGGYLDTGSITTTWYCDFCAVILDEEVINTGYC
jgi:hypothetical protein